MSTAVVLFATAAPSADAAPRPWSSPTPSSRPQRERATRILSTVATITLPTTGTVVASVTTRDALNTLEFGSQSPNNVVVCNDAGNPSCGSHPSLSLGRFRSGTELVFYLMDRSCNRTFASTDTTHARIDAVSGSAWTIYWDDAGAGCTPDGDFNDLITNVTFSPSVDGIDTPGVVRAGSGGYNWYLSNDFHATVSISFTFGSCCATPLVGDWNGDGIDSPGVNVGGNSWVLNDGYDGQAEYQFTYGNPGDKPVVGDWDGDGRDTIGVVRNGTWYLRNNLTGGPVDVSFGFGNPGDVPLAGDWNGDGVDTPGVKRDQWWYLSNGFNANVAYALVYGNPGDQGLVGDWNGDGVDTPGVKRNQWWYLSNDFNANVAYALVYGNDQGDTGVVGDWDSSPPPPGEQVDEVLEYYTDPSTQATSTPVTTLPIWAKYAPVVYIHPTEQYLPASVRYFLDGSELKFSNEGWGDDTVLNNTELRGPDGSRRNWRRLGFLNPISSVGVNSQVRFWTDQHTRPYDGGRDPALGDREGFFLNLLGTDHRTGVGTSAPVYYEWSPGACSSQGCTPGYITYWFFYAYDLGANVPGNFDHEGDWERISIHLNSNKVPTEVAYYRHACYRILNWSTQVQKEGTHPVVYSAYGSHGSYATPNGTDNCAPGDDGVQAGGARWATWLRMGSVVNQPWYGYGGAWGEVGDVPDGITTGPLGPSPWKPPHPPEFG